MNTCGIYCFCNKPSAIRLARNDLYPGDMGISAQVAYIQYGFCVGNVNQPVYKERVRVKRKRSNIASACAVAPSVS